MQQNKPYLIDALQFANWSAKVFQQMREGGVDAVHATISYHGSFRDVVASLIRWNRRFEQYSDLIMHGTEYNDLQRARQTSRTAVFFGVQNPACIEDDLGLVEILHRLGLRFMQLTYNNQSLLGSGYQETEDTGVTLMGKQVIAEMNRLGMIIDLSHAGERTAMEAIELSTRPVAVTHANPRSWHFVKRNVPDKVLEALRQTGGMLGLSLYPFHLKNGSECRIEAFCQMAADIADRYGVSVLGIGSDLCQDQPASVLHWMRHGRWSFDTMPAPGFPKPADWFQTNLHFGNIASGLTRVGFNTDEVAAVLGENWRRFFRESFVRQDHLPDHDG